jgi:hypothetical protein
VHCLTDEQLEQLTARPSDATAPAMQAHVQGCSACRQKLEQARANAALVGDIRELREHRKKVKLLEESLTASTAPPGQAAQKPGS